MHAFHFTNTCSSNRVRRSDGNGINILGKNVNVNLTLVTISTNRIVNPQTKIGTVSDKQNTVKPFDQQNNGENSTREWLPSVAGIIAALGSFCITTVVLKVYKFRIKKSHSEAPENGTLIVLNSTLSEERSLIPISKDKAVFSSSQDM